MALPGGAQLATVRLGLRPSRSDRGSTELSKPTREPASSRFDALFRALSVPQRKAIANTLHDLAEQDPDGSPGRAARAAIDDAWKVMVP